MLQPSLGMFHQSFWGGRPTPPSTFNTDTKDQRTMSSRPAAFILLPVNLFQYSAVQCSTVLCSVLHCTDPTLRFCTVLYSVVQCSAVQQVVLRKALASPHVTSEFPLSLQTAAVILHLTVTYMLLLLNIHNKLLYYRTCIITRLECLS